MYWDHMNRNSPDTSGQQQPAESGTSHLFRLDGLENLLFGFRSTRAYITKSERAYAAVRRAIVTHALPHGVPLDEAMLQHHFPVGRTPLREALKRLSYEGLLNWPPHQAPSIRDVGLYELKSLFETRRLIEYHVAGCAAERATADDILHMEMIRQKLAEAAGEGLIYEAVELDYALHAAIAEAAQNRFLVEASNNLNLQSLRLWFRAQRELGITNVDHMHTSLVRAISEHDVHTAQSLATMHIDSSVSRQQQLLITDSRPEVQYQAEIVPEFPA